MIRHALRRPAMLFALLMSLGFLAAGIVLETGTVPAMMDAAMGR